MELWILLGGFVLGWLAYEYLSPWGTVRKLRDMEEKNE
jgi:hypothetical protein